MLNNSTMEISEQSTHSLYSSGCSTICKCSTCASCRRLDAFELCLPRLTDAATKGFTVLMNSVIQEELIIGRQYNVNEHINSDLNSEEAGLEIDSDVRSLMLHYHGTGDYEPVKVEDGSFFTALSIALCGGDKLSTALRILCCIELIKNKQHYLTLPNSALLQTVAASFEEACVDCIMMNAMASIWVFYAASTVIKQPIVSIYPPVNTVMDRTFQILNTTIFPHGMKNDNIDSSYIHILWCKADCPSPPEDFWVPDSFVPLITRESELHPIQSLSVETYMKRKHQPQSSRTLDHVVACSGEYQEDEQVTHTEEVSHTSHTGIITHSRDKGTAVENVEVQVCFHKDKQLYVWCV